MFSAIILLTRFCNILQKQIQLFCLLFQSSSKEGFLTKRGAIVKVMRSIFNICEFLQNVLQYLYNMVPRFKFHTEASALS